MAAGRPGDSVRVVAGAGRVDFCTPHGLTDAEGVRLLGTRELRR